MIIDSSFLEVEDRQTAALRRGKSGLRHVFLTCKTVAGNTRLE
jgi:hypothetical protein